MTRHEVIVTAHAQREIWAAHNYIAERSPLNAKRWLIGLYASVNSLEQFPSRCGEAREAARFREPLKQLIYKSHRIIFRIDAEAVVHVISVRHAKRRPMQKRDSPEA